MRPRSPFITARQVRIDDLPVVNMHAVPIGHQGAATVDELARLEAFRDELVKRLKGDGCSRHWLSQRTGVPIRQCSAFLRQLGAYQAHGSGVWRLPNPTRKNNWGKI